MGSAGICNKCCNPTGKLASPPIQIPENSQEESESFYDMPDTQNQPHTGGFMFEVKQCEIPKEPIQKIVKHNSNQSINTELCSKSTNVNFTSHTTSVPSPYSLQKTNKEANIKENTSVEKDIHLSPIKTGELDKLKINRIDDSISVFKLPMPKEKKDNESTLFPILEANTGKISELSETKTKIFFLRYNSNFRHHWEGSSIFAPRSSPFCA